MTVHQLLLQLFCLFSLINIGKCYSKDPKRPNFVLILSDDQDLVFDSMIALPTVTERIKNEGQTFTNGFVATSICCPSRVETLTGRFFQNIGPPNGNCMGIEATENTFSNNSMFSIFHNNGYKTGMFGKLHNVVDFWCDTEAPVSTGFDRIFAQCKENYYAESYFEKFDNGSYSWLNLSETITAANYMTSMIGNSTLDWLTSDELVDSNDPFFVWIGPHAPHSPAVPAEWYAEEYSDLKAWRTPNYNFSGNGTMHEMIAQQPYINEEMADFIDQSFRNRLRTLKSVDDIVKTLFDDVLDPYELLDNTYIVFMSDHGYHLGQWCIVNEKGQIYETDLRIPFYMRGPNIEAGSNNTNMVLNIDVLPTFMELAQIGRHIINDSIDGESMTPLFSEDQISNWRTEYVAQFIAPNSQCGYKTWFPDFNSSTPNYPGIKLWSQCQPNPDKPNLYLIDDMVSNNWRVLRILNETTNVAYAEYVNPNWTYEDFENPQFYEFYDISQDEYQMNNSYSNLTTQQRNHYHELLLQIANCSAHTCKAGTNNHKSGSSHNKHRLGTGWILVIVVGVLICIGLAIALHYNWFLKKRRETIARTSVLLEHSVQQEAN